MKKCALIICYVNNQYRKDLLQKQTDFFNKLGIDPIVVSSDHVDKIQGVKNYITIKYVSDTQYLSDDLYPFTMIQNTKYYKKEAYENITAKSFFLKLFQCSFPYCKGLGYDFCYVLDFDNVIKKEHVPVAFGNPDFSKVYFHKFEGVDGYQGAFFYGNLNVLSDIFSKHNLDKLENIAKGVAVNTNEEAYFILANEFKDSVTVLPYGPDDLYSVRNMFSSTNVADFYFDKNTREYFFLQLKGDTCQNEFACELLMEDTVIHANKLSSFGLWFRFKLDDYKNYTVKYYDAEISSATLYKTTTIYTDPNNPTVKNWIEKI